MPDPQKEPRRKNPPEKAVHSPSAPAPSIQRKLRKEREWADRTEQSEPEPYEETYRDGSLKNECW